MPDSSSELTIIHCVTNLCGTDNMVCLQYSAGNDFTYGTVILLSC